MSFKQYLKENKTGNTIVCSFARMNPSTIGHGLLVKKAMDLSRQKHCEHVIYLSKTQDKKSNPLDVATKVKVARQMFPGANILPATTDLATFIDMVKFLNKKYQNLYLVAGSDRVAEYQKLLDKYNGSEYNYDSIIVVSAGERDPDAEGAAGMSATKMRKAAASNNVDEFKKGLPEHMYKKAQTVMNSVRKGMGL